MRADSSWTELKLPTDLEIWIELGHHDSYSQVLRNRYSFEGAVRERYHSAWIVGTRYDRILKVSRALADLEGKKNRIARLFSIASLIGTSERESSGSANVPAR